MTHSFFANASSAILHPSAPYNFALTVNAARFYAVLGRRHEDSYRRIVRVGTGLALLEIRNSGTVDIPQLDARLLATSGNVALDLLSEKLPALLNLHVDLSEFYQYARTDPVLSNTVEEIYGLRTLAADSIFEALILSIIEQQISLRMAHAAERWLIEWAGEHIEHQGVVYSAFPTPERLATATVEELKPLKITFQRMARILEIARAVTDGSLDLEGLRTMPQQDAYAILRSIKGVGHWTAIWTMIKGMGYYGNFGSADVGLRAAVNAYYFGLSGNASREIVDTLLARYVPFDGIAAFYTLMRWALEKYDYL
jgi:DNA-3-methyladenine glycosylase II